jgi:hypothetical protein
MNQPSQTHALILHPEEHGILLLPEDEGWALPVIESVHVHSGSVASFNRAILDLTGIEATVLRCAWRGHLTEAGPFEEVYEMEYHGIMPARDFSGRWWRRKELSTLPLTRPEHYPLIEHFLRDCETLPRAGSTQTWANPGWWDHATGWIAAQLQSQRQVRVNSVAQLRVWELGNVLRVRAHEEEFYFKALTPPLARELALGVRLAQRHPRHVPAVIAFEPRQLCLLTQAHHGPMLNELSDISVWKRALEAYALVQTEWLDGIAELRELGCVERTLERLEKEIDPLFADAAAMLQDEPGGLSRAEIETLRQRAPSYKAMCRQLAEYNIGPTIEHGDFWAGNIIIDDGEAIFLDWSDACVAHPFFSLLPLFLGLNIHNRLSHIPDAQDQLTAVYLRTWLPFETEDRLREAFSIAYTLSAIHHAVNYQQNILPLVETSLEIRHGIPEYLKTLLDKNARPNLDHCSRGMIINR